MENYIVEKTDVVRRLVRNGYGLPRAIKAWNQLSQNETHQVTNEDVNGWIKESFKQLKGDLQ